MKQKILEYMRKAGGFFGNIGKKTGGFFRDVAGKAGKLTGKLGKYSRSIVPGITCLLIVMIFTGAIILDNADGTAYMDGMPVSIADAVYIPNVVEEEDGEVTAYFDEDEVIYDGEKYVLPDADDGDAQSGEGTEYTGQEGSDEVTEQPVIKNYFSRGDSDPQVATIQARLMKLGYMDEDEPTEYYGPATETAIERFQLRHELEKDGNAGEETIRLLFSSDAKKYSMSLGMEGEDVAELQKMLRNLGYFNSSATGYFGSDTESALKEFQQKNGLSTDGSAGHDTLEKLFSGNVVANYLGFGEEGDTVLALQKRLKSLGYLTTEPDGKYGRDTVQAVKRFQEANGLMVDGYFGYDTKVLLNSGDAAANAFSIGDSGAQVENIQKRLVELKYMKKATGYYGETTDEAIRSFQKRNGLSVDGKVGQKTLKTLFSDKAKKAPTSTPKPTATPKPKKSSSSKSTPKPTKSSSSKSTPKPTKTSSGEKVKVTGANADSLIAVAKTKLGCKYVKGGKGPDTFDCSGFVYWCLRQIGVNISYMTSSGWKNCTKYETVSSLSSVKKGDIIVFKGHVGIAMGDGKMIDASSSDGCIRIAKLSNNYWKTNFIKACRLF